MGLHYSKAEAVLNSSRFLEEPVLKVIKEIVLFDIHPCRGGRLALGARHNNYVCDKVIERFVRLRIIHAAIIAVFNCVIVCHGNTFLIARKLPVGHVERGDKQFIEIVVYVVGGGTLGHPRHALPALHERVVFVKVKSVHNQPYAIPYNSTKPCPLGI